MSEQPMKMNEPVKSNLSLGLNILAGIIVVAAMAVTSYTASAVGDLRERVAVIEANRFTSSDGLAIWKEISALREHIAQLPSEAPPQWFVDKVNKIEERQEKILEAIGRLDRVRQPGP